MNPKNYKDFYEDVSKEAEDDVLVDQLVVEEEEEKPSAASNDYKKLSLSELNSLLEQAVAAEDYEAAAKIRDEISKRN